MTNIHPPARRSLALGILLFAIPTLSACIVSESSDSPKKKIDTSAVAPPSAAPAESTEISVPADVVASKDTAGLGSQTDSLGTTAARVDTSAQKLDAGMKSSGLTKFPSRIPARGAVPLAIEVMLDRVTFSPGIIDGTWGKNAAKALKWFRVSNGMDSSTATSIDKATYDALVAASQSSTPTQNYLVTASDLQGPFTVIPDTVYEQAKLKCMCYRNVTEKLSERFHVSQKLLAQLNPKVKLDSLRAGTTLVVPNVRDPAAASPNDTVIVARLIVSKSGFWTHALDANGRVVYHFPSTLGAGYDPSPTGDFKVTDVSRDPAFHYQPKLFAEVPDTKPEAHLKPGPNSPVGVIWISLSKPHYGIHGTASPETIGYANSHGCVRLTNWDALRLAEVVEPGTPVQFQ